MSGCDIELYAVIPHVLDHASVISSNAPDDDLPEWDEAETYYLGQELTWKNHVIVSLVNANTGNYPYSLEGASDSPLKYFNGWHLRQTRVYTWDAARSFIKYQVTNGVDGEASEGYKYKSLVADNLNNTLPAGAVDNASWQYIGIASDYWQTRQDIENGGLKGEEFYDPRYQTYFILSEDMPADDLLSDPEVRNYFPIINRTSGLPESSKWRVKGLINNLRVFDPDPFAQTERPESLSFVFSVNAPMTTLFFKNISGNSVEGVIKNSVGTEIKIISHELIENYTNWWDYIWTYGVDKPDFQVDDLPMDFAYTVEVTINAPNGIAKAGAVGFGVAQSLGVLDYTPRIGSRVYVDQGNNADYGGKVTKKINRIEKFANFELASDSERLDDLVRVANLSVEAFKEGRPMHVYTLRGMHQSFVLYGYIKTHAQGLERDNMTRNNIKIEGAY